MKKYLFSFLILILFTAFSDANAQNDVRVKCNNITMNVTSGNVHCYQTESSIPISGTPTKEALVNAQIANTAIHFSDFDSISSSIKPEVIFYPVEELGTASFSLLDISFTLSDKISRVKAGTLPAGSFFSADSENTAALPESEINLGENLQVINFGGFQSAGSMIPFLPCQSGEPSFSALSELIENEYASGMRAVLSFEGQIAANGSASNLYYTWQGMSKNGKYYISAVFPLRSQLLDSQSAATIDREHYDGNELQPSLAQLDFFIRSIVIE